MPSAAAPVPEQHEQHTQPVALQRFADSSLCCDEDLSSDEASTSGQPDSFADAVPGTFLAPSLGAVSDPLVASLQTEEQLSPVSSPSAANCPRRGDGSTMLSFRQQSLQRLLSLAASEDTTAAAGSVQQESLLDQQSTSMCDWEAESLRLPELQHLHSQQHSTAASGIYADARHERDSDTILQSQRQSFSFHAGELFCRSRQQLALEGTQMQATPGLAPVQAATLAVDADSMTEQQVSAAPAEMHNSAASFSDSTVSQTSADYLGVAQQRHILPADSNDYIADMPSLVRISTTHQPTGVNQAIELVSVFLPLSTCAFHCRSHIDLPSLAACGVADKYNAWLALGPSLCFRLCCYDWSLHCNLTCCS